MSSIVPNYGESYSVASSGRVGGAFLDKNLDMKYSMTESSE